MHLVGFIIRRLCLYIPLFQENIIVFWGFGVTGSNEQLGETSDSVHPCKLVD